MAQWKKTRDEVIDAVRIAKITDPQKSLRDIQRETGINHQTVSDIIEDIPELLTSSDKWAKILDTMDEIIDWIASITSVSIKTIQSKVNDWTLSVSDLKALNDIAKNNFDRKQLLTGKSTSNVNIIWDVLSEIQWMKSNS